jgi:hypothetical protein
VPRARVISSPPNIRHQRLIDISSPIRAAEGEMGRSKILPGVGVAAIKPRF